MPFGPLSGRGGALVSATRTSPFGSTCSHRGWFKPRAKATTDAPPAGSGAASGGHPFAVTTLTTGINEPFGGGRTGLAPVPSMTLSLARAPHATEAAAAA